MTSIYFPARVLILFRRLVNVVSTLSISNHYISHSQSESDDVPRIVDGLKQATYKRRPPSEVYGSSVWSWCAIRSTWDNATQGTVHEIRNLYSEVPGQGAVAIPKLRPGSLSFQRLFSFQPQQPESASDPPTRPSYKSSREENCARNEPDNGQVPRKTPVDFPNRDRPLPPDIIHQLLANPALYDPLRTPRFPIVLCHGLYGFDSRGPTTFPSMRMHYWSNVLRILRGQVGAEVIVTSVPGTGSITSRAMKLDEHLKFHARGRGINFLAHSMGGLDCRHLISHIQPRAYAPLSLTSISTPHRGSPFMDWCATNIGIGKLRQQEKELKEELRRSSRRDIHFPSSEDDDEGYLPTTASTTQSTRMEPKASDKENSFSLTSLPSLILSIVDSPAYANLTSHYLNEVFNPATPNDPHVKYWSVAGRISAKSVSVWHPFWLPKMVLDGAEETERERLKKAWEQEYPTGTKKWSEADGVPPWADGREWGNDGLVTVQSAKWGEFLGILEGSDHWEMRGARGIEFGVDLPALPALGLGSSPHPTSMDDPSTTQAQGDGWGFGEWTRFVGAWKKSKDDNAVVTEAATVENLNKKVTPSETREDENAFKTSTDKISVIFDWLIERVPAPTTMAMPSTASNIKDKEEMNKGANLRVEESGKSLHTSAVGGGSRRTPLQATPSEMKQRMDREDKRRENKRELASRQDLERFYIALARQMYDAGL